MGSYRCKRDVPMIIEWPCKTLKKLNVIKCWLALVVINFLNINIAYSLPVYEQPPLGNGEAVGSSVSESQYRAENFTLVADTSIASISWWGVYVENELPPNAAFTVQLYGSVAGSPGALIQNIDANVSALDTPSNTGLVATSEVLSIFQFDLSFASPIQLSFGEYFIAIMNDVVVPGREGEFDWKWLESNVGDGSHWSSPSGSAWQQIGAGAAAGVPSGNLAFSVHAKAPTGVLSSSATIWLALLGLISAYSARKSCSRWGGQVLASLKNRLSSGLTCCGP